MATSFTGTTYSENFVGSTGIPRALRYTLEITDRAGNDGHWVALKGKKAEQFTIRTWVDVADAATAKTKLSNSYPNILTGNSGETVTFTRDGETWGNLILIDFTPVVDQDSPAIAGGIAGGTRVLIVDWTVQFAS